MWDMENEMKLNIKKGAEAAEFLKAIEAQKFPIKSVPLPGRFEHFANEEMRQAHLKYIEDQKENLPF